MRLRQVRTRINKVCRIEGKKWKKLSKLVETDGRCNQFSRPSLNRSPHSALASAPHAQWLSAAALKSLESAGTNAHRFYSSATCSVERFGEDVLISFQNEACRDQTLRELREWSQTHGRTFRRLFGRFLPRHNEERTAPVLIGGDAAASSSAVVQENGMNFSIDFTGGYSVGLFIDQRSNRTFLRRSASRRVLNTFAYTCSFSVAAALGGAETTNVDLSKKSLDRGRENFALNGIDAAPHRFISDDILEVLPRFARKRELFDAIVLDPPTFSRGPKGRRFQVEQDFEKLLLTALEVAAPKARVLLSTNCARVDRAALESMARFCLKASRRTAKFHREPELFDVPAPFAAETLWLLLQ